MSQEKCNFCNEYHEQEDVPNLGVPIKFCPNVSKNRIVKIHKDFTKNNHKGLGNREDYPELKPLPTDKADLYPKPEDIKLYIDKIRAIKLN